MKRLAIAFVFSSIFYLFLSHLACDKHPVSIPSPPPTSTPTATPIAVQISLISSTFSPAAVTVSVGNNIIFTNFDGYPHTVHPDDGFGSCGTNQFVNPASSVTLNYSSPITINYHCWFHSACFGPPCDLSCDGGPGANMIGSIVVQ